jgi:hypothetical protein
MRAALDINVSRYANAIATTNEIVAMIASAQSSEPGTE